MRIAILDDYFNGTLRLADWSQLEGRAEIKVFTEHLGGEENAAKGMVDQVVIGVLGRARCSAGEPFQ